ncbi:hypothetical protein BT96DRAFT_945951 [Gymnopus androsaceus JB14]|uniref:DUF6532 domain-containing protein n=1 Tax=Gymnopus androsaceus JB14 TaxID=1447944 RepID=A0A6A4GY55_9AGAR|nr:hypothetical protein BT96DRAFT_945951 [Gymnopus androsaceus JB14]
MDENGIPIEDLESSSDVGNHRNSYWEHEELDSPKLVSPLVNWELVEVSHFNVCKCTGTSPIQTCNASHEDGVTQGKKVNIHPSLLPRTREERKPKKDEKVAKAQEAKEAIEVKQTRKAKIAKQKIAQIGDKRALEQVDHRSLRPDLDLRSHLPPPTTLSVMKVGSLPKAAAQMEPSPEPEPSHVTAPGRESFTSESDYISNMDVDDLGFEHTYEDHSFSINDGDGSDGYPSAGDNSDLDDFDYAAALQELMKARRESKKHQAKEKKRKMASDIKKVQKTAVCDGVTSAHVEAPAASIDVIKSGANVKKRVSTSNETNIAKQAKPELGRLRVDFRKITASKPKALLSLVATSNESQANSEPNYFTIPGEFDQEEQPESVAAVHASKQRNNSEGKKQQQQRVGQMAGISLIPTNVSAIDMKERHGSIPDIQCTPGKWQNVTKANLPLSTATDQRKWDTDFMPTIIDFVGAQEFQFGMSNNVDLKFFIKSTWNTVYPLLKELKDNPTIATLVHNQIHTYRSKIGKKAMLVVAQRLNMLKDDVEECATWVALQLHEDNWAYNSPGNTRATSSGAMRGSMILETFAYHSKLARTFKAKSKSGFPAGALALSAAAVLRALHAHTPGYNSIKYARQVEDVERKKEGKSRVSRNTKDSFRDAPWSDFVSIYFRLLSKANEAKWMVIFDETEPFINVRRFERCQGELAVGEELDVLGEYFGGIGDD